MAEKLNVQPSPTTMTVTGEIDGVAILLTSHAGSWSFFDPAPAKSTTDPFDLSNLAVASGSGEAFSVEEAVALVRVLVKVHRRAIPSPSDVRDTP